MTEYGRGPGSQPWHPEDPLYGDPEWGGGQHAGYQDGWNQSPQQGGYEGQPGYPADPGAQQPYYQQQPPYPQQQQYPPQQPQYQEQQQYQQPVQQQPVYQQYGGGWDTQGGGQHYDPSYGGVGTDPYGIPPVDPYGTGEQPAYPGYQGAQAQGGYPQQQPQYLREQPAPPHQPGPVDPDPDTGWDPGPDQGEHAFFTERDEDELDFLDEDDEGGRRGRRGGKSKKRGGETKRKSGCACVVVSLVLVAGVGVVGYFGYDFYQAHFAPAPDFAGPGSGDVMVDIPDGASLADMGEVLKREGVVKSPGAFVDAAGDNKKAQSIQAGTYTLRKQMSGANAVDLMLDPASQNGLIVSEGWRASQVYEAIDKKLDVPKGTTKKAAGSGKIGLPKWARGKPEGFLFPSKYSVGKDSEPADVLKQMVARAEAEYAKTGLESAAKKAGKTPEQIITVASLVQAEAQQDHEFGKVSRVIYNRLDQDMRLGFDSTINYAMGRSTLDTSLTDTKYPSKYNTYLHKGLPPGPIGNPGHQAIEAALKPTKGDWLFFVTVKPGDTRFTADENEHQKNVEDFNEVQRENGKKKGNGG
ncbi:endolytic transglycosylase MltG [Streptomyces iconiensis]|uniref:Endolytic murein transglycosylase n=1 Tax=Streptomyces iconiensis TaxID=1384038 RepID=A0ABT6ZTG6_9ACTN|nr:endolytic transglycosylase MltG [Streptomyces iconiensis]MDJ1132362.1 endolytic transglycosylase MltG [Streptomyces iconiensis]